MKPFNTISNHATHFNSLLRFSFVYRSSFGIAIGVAEHDRKCSSIHLAKFNQTHESFGTIIRGENLRNGQKQCDLPWKNYHHLSQYRSSASIRLIRLRLVQTNYIHRPHSNPFDCHRQHFSLTIEQTNKMHKHMFSSEFHRFLFRLFSLQ